MESRRLPGRLRGRIAVPGEDLSLSEVGGRLVGLRREQVDEADLAPVQHLEVAPGDRVLELCPDLRVDVVVLLVGVDHERRVLDLRLGSDLAHADGGDRGRVQLPDRDFADHLAFVPLRSAGIDLQLHLPLRRLGEVLRHRDQELVPGGALRRERAQLDAHGGLRRGGGGGEQERERDSLHAIDPQSGKTSSSCASK